MWTTEDLNTPCTRLGVNVCSNCLQSMREMRPIRCYRSGRAVSRRIRLRALIRSIPTRERNIWDSIRENGHQDPPQNLQVLLKRFYGPKYEGPYAQVSLAKGLELFENRRFWLRGIPARTWKEINESLGLKLGRDTLHELMYYNNPFYKLIKKDEKLGIS